MSRGGGRLGLVRFGGRPTRRPKTSEGARRRGESGRFSHGPLVLIRGEGHRVSGGEDGTAPEREPGGSSSPKDRPGAAPPSTNGSTTDHLGGSSRVRMSGMTRKSEQADEVYPGLCDR